MVTYIILTEEGFYLINFIREQGARKKKNIFEYISLFFLKIITPILNNSLLCILILMTVFDVLLNILFYYKAIFIETNILLTGNIIVLSFTLIALLYTFWIIPIKTINAQIKKMNLKGEIVPLSYNFLCPKAIKYFFSSYNYTLERLNLYKSENANLSVMAITDGLTGVSNYRGFSEYINMLENSAYEDAFLLFCDLDNFKKINDTFGHNIGDKVLSQTASILSDVFDFYGNVFRYGGEEFAIIMRHQDKKFIYSLAEEFRKKIENSFEIITITKGYSISISIGISYLSKEVNNFNDLLKFADIALYKAKSNGKNCIIFYDEMKVKV